MDVSPVPRINGALLFRPSPHVDDRGFFCRTFDAEVLRAAGLDPAAFIQHSQSKSTHGASRRRHHVRESAAEPQDGPTVASDGPPKADESSPTT